MDRSRQDDHPRVGPARRQGRGVTLVELVTVLAIMALVALLAVPSMSAWRENQRLRDAARDLADLLQVSRSEAARTGKRLVLIYGPPGTTEPGGNTLQDADGSWVPVLVFNDGSPATSDCQLAASEAREWLPAVDGLSWGVSLATERAPNDSGAAPFTPPQSSGGTTADPSNNAVPWLMFRPDGIPVRFEGTGGGGCGAIGSTARGGAAFYLTNGRRDHAIVLSPMGALRVHVWDEVNGGWST